MANSETPSSSPLSYAGPEFQRRRPWVRWGAIALLVAIALSVAPRVWKSVKQEYHRRMLPGAVARCLAWSVPPEQVAYIEGEAAFEANVPPGDRGQYLRGNGRRLGLRNNDVPVRQLILHDYIAMRRHHRGAGGASGNYYSCGIYLGPIRDSAGATNLIRLSVSFSTDTPYITGSLWNVAGGTPTPSATLSNCWIRRSNLSTRLTFHAGKADPADPTSILFAITCGTQSGTLRVRQTPLGNVQYSSDIGWIGFGRNDTDWHLDMPSVSLHSLAAPAFGLPVNLSMNHADNLRSAITTDGRWAIVVTDKACHATEIKEGTVVTHRLALDDHFPGRVVAPELSPDGRLVLVVVDDAWGLFEWTGDAWQKRVGHRIKLDFDERIQRKRINVDGEGGGFQVRESDAGVVVSHLATNATWLFRGRQRLASHTESRLRGNPHAGTILKHIVERVQSDWTDTHEDVAASFSPDGRRLAVVDDRGWLVWDLSTGNLLHEWDQRNADFGPRAVWSADGQKLAMCDGWYVYTLDLSATPAALTRMPSLASNDRSSLAFDASGNRLIVMPAGKGQIDVWKLP